jgi:hypothetical protein
LGRQFGLEKLFRVDVSALTFNKLRLACEEAALSHGLNVPMIEIIVHQDMRISSNGTTLYLASELAEMPGAPLQAMISFALYFHTQMALSQRVHYQAPLRFAQRLAALIVGLRSAPRRLGESDGARARDSAKACYRGSHVALLQALLMSRGGIQTDDQSFLGEPLFEDAEQINEFARHLESLIEGDFADDSFLQLRPTNKLLQMAHKTSKLLDANDRNASSQVASLNRLYQSTGPVGSVAYFMSRVSNQALSDHERIQLLVDLLANFQPIQVRLQLVDFTASQLMALSEAQKLSLMTLLRETLSTATCNADRRMNLHETRAQDLGQESFSDYSPILTWTLLSVLRSKLNLNDLELGTRKPLTDKAKRRCIGELFFVAAELGGAASSISARALRDQVDAVCEALDIDRPVSSPDEFQAAAWLEALEDLTRFSLHETLSILDALSLWGLENVIYQAWLDAICQRLKVQRQLTHNVKPEFSTADQASLSAQVTQ